jgi:photosystem II stability/assembly factor-like uncharacterized protein
MRLRRCSLAALLLLPWLAGSPATGANSPAEILPQAYRSLLTGLDLAGDRLVAVGERGHILLSDDYGKAWRQVATPTRATLTAVHFPTPQLGWAVGHDNMILHSGDGGESWRLQYPAGNEEQSFLSVYFVDARRGVAVGAYGLFFKTADGGASWQRQTIHDDELHYNRISRGPDGRLFIAAEGGMLLVSGDDGGTWDELESPYEGSWFGVLPLTARTLLAHGLRGNLFRTTDGGAQWAELEINQPTLLAAALRLGGGPVVVGGQNGHLFISYDGGRQFKYWHRPEIKGVTAMIEAPDGALIVTSLNGVHTLRIPAALP